MFLPSLQVLWNLEQNPKSSATGTSDGSSTEVMATSSSVAAAAAWVGRDVEDVTVDDDDANSECSVIVNVSSLPHMVEKSDAAPAPSKCCSTTPDNKRDSSSSLLQQQRDSSNNDEIDEEAGFEEYNNYYEKEENDYEEYVKMLVKNWMELVMSCAMLSANSQSMRKMVLGFQSQRGNMSASTTTVMMKWREKQLSVLSRLLVLIRV
jgi:hypothetical protein